jgi:hypothetical protein
MPKVSKSKIFIGQMIIQQRIFMDFRGIFKLLAMLFGRYFARLARPKQARHTGSGDRWCHWTGQGYHERWRSAPETQKQRQVLMGVPYCH